MNTNWLIERPIAHRGFHNKQDGIYENTLAAFTRAIDHNFAIECDLQFSTDGIPVIFHDAHLERLCGLQADIRSKKAYELTRLSIGGTPEYIPTLDNALKLVSGRTPLLLELKGSQKDDDGFADAVLRSLENYQGHVAIMSFDHHLLKDMLKLSCPYPLGLTAQGSEPEIFFISQQALAYNISFISYSIEDLPNAFIQSRRKQDQIIISWTVTNHEQRLYSNKYADQITFEGFHPEHI